MVAPPPLRFPAVSDLPQKADRALTAGVLLLPGALLAVLSLHSGGFFPDWSALVTLVVLLALLLRATLGSKAFAGLSAGLLAGGAALTAFTLWVLLSGSWSGSWARAILEYSRDLGYVALFVLFGLLGRAPGRARVLVLGLAAAAAVIAALALVAWLRPDVLDVGSSFSRERLSWPLSYWNTTGLVAALGGLWCLHLTCADPSRVVRVLGAAAIPVCSAVVYFTVSRGAVVAGVVGLAVYLLSGPSRGLLTGLLAGGAGLAAGLLLAAGTEGLNVAVPSAAARADGRAAGTTMLLIVAGVAALRGLLLAADARLARVPIGPVFRRRAWSAVGATAAIAIAIGIGLGGVHQARKAYDKITTGGTVPSDLAPSQRFTQLSSNGRIGHWRVAIDEGFEPHRLHGAGAGTFALQWAHGRTSSFTVVDAHSLYVEVLSELGIVGLVLLAGALLAMLVAMARRTRGPNGPVWGALLAAAVAWMVRAGFDWDWEMPAVTLWVMAAGGLALGAPLRRSRGDGIMPVRVAVGLGCLLLALVPFAVLRSQSALADAVDAFHRGDCATTVDRALRSSAALSVRAEPFELLAWCDVRLGRPALARAAVDAGLRRDPHNWELHYDDALIRAAAGEDPRPAIRRAQELNPFNESVIAAAAVLGRPHSPRAWTRFARRATLPLPG